ncbi:hypothetical protein [Rubellicoccus peritrichatus]|uniref:Uncharacterized protein n=1 Tax=Rubellicoccus peritrichatus TaxID=3080537 RepID=A0AAQ3LAJ3_9BACT|nr:hypothetical protein [Puniceicoccus sp. CR14]WOO41697.1 hypothetical protein RZN69_01255 [Puniceicoccus sp. CR14]
MSNHTSYIVFWMIMFVILGAFWYIIDRRYGVKWYRLWYRLTHKDPLPDNIAVGFVYNRRSRHKAVMAAVLSTLQTFVALYSVQSLNLLVELVLWLVEIPMTMIGFMIGPFAFKLWGRKDEMLDAIDDLEQKHLGGRDIEDDSTRDKAKEVKVKPAAKKEPEPAPAPKEEKPDPKKLFDRYTKR